MVETTFSSQVKTELCAGTDEMNDCCRRAFNYGLLLFGRSFGTSGMGLVTEHRESAELYSAAVCAITGSRYPVNELRGGKFSVVVSRKADRKAAAEFYGLSERAVSLRINRANLADECCCAALVRGAFLACGTMTDPQKSYSLEFPLPYLHLTDDLLKILQEMDFLPKLTRRRSCYVIYFRNSEAIEDLLSKMGAQKSAFDLMEIKVEKHVKNKINRRMNFESANMDRCATAAVNQLDAVRKLKASGRFDSLSDELKELAQLRLDNPEDSLRELGEKLSVSLSRSGVYHRLEKIVSLAEE